LEQSRGAQVVKRPGIGQGWEPLEEAGEDGRARNMEVLPGPCSRQVADKTGAHGEDVLQTSGGALEAAMAQRVHLADWNMAESSYKCGHQSKTGGAQFTGADTAQVLLQGAAPIGFALGSSHCLEPEDASVGSGSRQPLRETQNPVRALGEGLNFLIAGDGKKGEDQPFDVRSQKSVSFEIAEKMERVWKFTPESSIDSPPPSVDLLESVSQRSSRMSVDLLDRASSSGRVSADMLRPEYVSKSSDRMSVDLLKPEYLSSQMETDTHVSADVLGGEAKFRHSYPHRLEQCELN